MNIEEKIYTTLSNTMRDAISKSIDTLEPMASIAWFKTGFFKSDIDWLIEEIEKALKMHSNKGNVRMQR